MRILPHRLTGWLFVAVCAGLVSACQKVQLPSDENGNSPTQEQPVPESGNDGPVVVPEEYCDAMTVAQVQAAYSGVTTSDEIFCAVIGYVVGYADRSVNNAVFSADGAVESNILIADRQNENRPACCLPVQLVNGTNIRNELNLAENPELLGTRIYIAGYISKYYATVGMRNPEYYEWVVEGDDEPEEEPEPTPEPDPEPDPSPTDEGKDTLDWDDEPVVIPGGR